MKSFDLAAYMRKSNYMQNMRADESKQGPLNIIKLPSATQPIAISEMTPKTLVDFGLFHKTNKYSDGVEIKYEDVSAEFEFHDINEDYEEIKRENKITELAYIASSKHFSFSLPETTGVEITSQ